MLLTNYVKELTKNRDLSIDISCYLFLICDINKMKLWHSRNHIIHKMAFI